MKTIAIPIETKVREFDGKLWLALNLVRRGYRVILGPTYEIQNTFDMTEPDIFITKDPGDSNIETFDRLQSAGISVCGLDTEGGVFGSIDQFAHNKKKILNYLDVYFLWGKKPASGVEQHYSGKNNLYVSGNPRFDLLQPQNRLIYQNQAKSYNEQYGEYILVNGNFGLANPIEAGQVISENKYKSVEQMYNHTSRVFHLFIEVIHYLQDKFSEAEIIIRPHPSEDKSTYKNEFKRYDRVHVENEGDVRTWIAGASLTIHHTSTTGIESALLGVPVVSYLPIQNEDYDSVLPQIVSKKAFDRKELVEYVSSSLDTNEPYKMNAEQTAHLKQYFYNVDISAAEMICDVIDSLEISPEKQYNLLNPNLMESVERRIKSSKFSDKILHIYDNFQQLVGNGSNREQRAYYKQKFPGLKETEIIERIDEFKQILELGPVSIEKVALTNNTFVLQQSESQSQYSNS